MSQKLPAYLDARAFIQGLDAYGEHCNDYTLCEEFVIWGWAAQGWRRMGYCTTLAEASEQCTAVEARLRKLAHLARSHS
jgi:hypothetical protein